MAEEHIGSLVLIDCGPSLGTYQGRISKVEMAKQAITLENPLRNGVPYQVPRITLKSEDIVDLRILQLADEFEKTLNDVLFSCRNGGKSTENSTTSMAEFALGNKLDNGHLSTTAGAFDGEKRGVVQEESRGSKQHFRISPNNLFRANQRKTSAKGLSPKLGRSFNGPGEEHQPYAYSYNRKHLSELSAPLDYNVLAEDFDFEGNLAKFEKLPKKPQNQLGDQAAAKQATVIGQLLSNIENGPKGNTEGSAANKTIKHNEYLIQDPSRVYVNAKRTWRYLADNGVEVQGLTAAQKRRLFDLALVKGWITRDGFAYSMADNAVRLGFNLTQEKGVPLPPVLVIFSSSDAVPTQIAKQLSRFFVNRGHTVTWITTNGSHKHGKESGVRVLNDASSLSNYTPDALSLVYVIGRQGVLADQVSSWLLRHSFGSIIFVETDWQGVDSLIPDEDLLLRLGLDGGSLVKLPSRLLLCWQLPCEEVDSDLKYPVYVCDTNMPSHFLESELCLLNAQKDARQKTKPYKCPFVAESVIKLRKL